MLKLVVFVFVIFGGFTAYSDAKPMKPCPEGSPTPVIPATFVAKVCTVTVVFVKMVGRLTLSLNYFYSPTCTPCICMSCMYIYNVVNKTVLLLVLI